MDSSEINPVSAHHLLVGYTNNAKKSFIYIGMMLHFLKKDNNFKSSTGGVDTWEEYLAQPELSLDSGEANRLIQIYETFCVKMGKSPDEIAEIPIKNLHYLLPKAKKEEDTEKIDELLDDAKVLSQHDFKERLHETYSKETDTFTYQFFLMKKCVETGKMNKVSNVDSDMIKEAFNLHD